ncbi:hypothetical protein BD626DRAFT_485033 [Schizophyllum amplum]|uniref:Uncharacterized protein n=1 Tax=Schizophyllum amplum TaxID=97359 RepID=A0A550CQW7_9AGAR|nr:hypothetical protein BD626DRAFT_485033 [Auriculariopsis ampla]
MSDGRLDRLRTARLSRLPCRRALICALRTSSGCIRADERERSPHDLVLPIYRRRQRTRLAR